MPKRLALISLYAPANVTADFAIRRPDPHPTPGLEVQSLLNEMADVEVPKLLKNKGFDAVPLGVLATLPAFQQLTNPDEKRIVASLGRMGGKQNGWVAANGYPIISIHSIQDPRSVQSLKELCASLAVQGIILVEVRLGYDDGWLRAAPSLQVKPVASSSVAVVAEDGSLLYQSPGIGSGADFVTGPTKVSLRNREIRWTPHSKAAYRQTIAQSLDHTLNLLSEPSPER